MAGDLQAELVGAGDADELMQAGDLRLPAEPPDPALLGAAHPAPDLGRLARRRGDQHLGRDLVDPAQAEQGRRVPLDDVRLNPVIDDGDDGTERSRMRPAGDVRSLAAWIRPAIGSSLPFAGAFACPLPLAAKRRLRHAA